MRKATQGDNTHMNRTPKCSIFLTLTIFIMASVFLQATATECYHDSSPDGESHRSTRKGEEPNENSKRILTHYKDRQSTIEAITPTILDEEEQVSFLRNRREELKKVSEDIENLSARLSSNWGYMRYS